VRGEKERKERVGNRGLGRKGKGVTEKGEMGRGGSGRRDRVGKQWRSHTSGVRGVRTPCQENT